MEKLHSVQISVGECTKEISVYCNDVTTFDERIDILTTSAFVDSYEPTPRTVFKALYDKYICVENLAKKPEFDLRDPCHVWLSNLIPANLTQIKRIGCIEFNGDHWSELDSSGIQQSMMNSIRAYFQMLDIAAVYGVKMSTIALPLLGSGSQNISSKLLLIPLINECISFLKRNHEAKRILFIERNPQKANLISESLKQSFRFINNDKQEESASKQNCLAFISYASADKNIADNLCNKLESNGVKVWYAPRDVKGPYASSIVYAIEKASHFIIILSQNSIASEHVLNEIDLAFQKLPSKIKFKPLRIDNALFTPSLQYYISRQHWMDATNPPLEERLNEFVNSLVDDIK